MPTPRTAVLEAGRVPTATWTAVEKEMSAGRPSRAPQLEDDPLLE